MRQRLQLAEQAAVDLCFSEPLGLLRQPEFEFTGQHLLVGIARLGQRLAAQGPLLHQSVFGKQLILLGRGEALLAQLFTLVKQLLQAGEVRIRRHRQAALRRQKNLVAGQQ